VPQNTSSPRLVHRLTTLFPSAALKAHAEDHDVIERRSKFQLPALVWTFVFGFANGECRTLAGFRRSYNSTADEPLSPGGFYHRLTPTFAAFLRDLVEFGLDEVAVSGAVADEIDRFRDVMIADGTVLRLHEFLSDEYKARKEEQAGAKLHLLHNVTEQVPTEIIVTDEKAHDSTLFDPGEWLAGRLVLFDRAYFKYQRFSQIDEHGGYFVSRLKTNTDPLIVEELREWRGRAIPLEGEQVQDVVDDLQRKYIDVEVEVEYRVDTRTCENRRFRVVGVREADADDYDLYITNLPREALLPADIATVYRCRWEVELLFRELKTRYELDEFDTEKEHVVEILVYAALLTLIVSRALQELVVEEAPEEAVIPAERWAATFRSHAQLILRELREHLGYRPPPLLERLIADAQKIHQERPILRERLVTATQSGCAN